MVFQFHNAIPYRSVSNPRENELAHRTIDDRVRYSKETILQVTSELLTETGLGGVSVDEVSRRSGIAKTTIYRHWPTRADLLMEACSRIAAEPRVPDTGSFEGDATALLANLADMLLTAKWPSVLPSVIDAAERDPAVAEMYRRIQQGHARPFQEVIQRAKRIHEISTQVDDSFMIAALIGPLFYRRWFSREPLDKAFLRAVLRSVIEFAKPGGTGTRRRKSVKSPSK